MHMVAKLSFAPEARSQAQLGNENKSRPPAKRG
jgi:hypothetical protein